MHRYTADYIIPGLTRTFAAAFDATAELVLAATVDRNTVATLDATCEVSCAGNHDRDCLASLEADVELAVALTVVAPTKRRRRGILVDGACR